MPLESNPLCEGCRSLEIDGNYWRWYGVAVCAACRATGGDRYRMITKSEAKEVRCASTRCCAHGRVHTDLGPRH
jgi:DNA-repair protein complementing XP-A cells